MIPNTLQQEVISSGVKDSVQFGISAEDSAHIMTILRSTLYSDKILAVIREYSANAWDAHREVGKDSTPIKVTLPTDIAPVLIIRDFGPGLSQDSVFKVFTQYGKSTKRSTNRAVGMLGIGSKSGFSYATSFTITTWHLGQKSIYNAALDPSNLGTLSLLHSEPCEPEESGTEIHIAVKKNDVWSFQNKAQNLFQYFVPRPDINIELPAPVANAEKLKNGIIRTDDTTWTAVMGCVPYRVALSQLTDVTGFDGENTDKFGGVFYFDIGEVQVNASREELEYSDYTKKALVEKFNALVDEYVEHTIAAIRSSNGTMWEKRLRAQSLNKLGLAPEGDVFAKWVVIKPDFMQKECKIYRGSELAHTVNVNPATRFVVQDEFTKTLNGYQLGEYDYLVKPTDKAQLQEARDALKMMINLLGIEGVPEVNLSTVSWYPKNNKSGFKVVNLKHRVKNFRLIPTDYFCKPYSTHWEAEAEREATDDDVYVILEGFQSVKSNFFGLYNNDKALATAFGLKMPPVYGYKSTQAKPVASAQGTEYGAWSEKFRKSLLTDAALDLLALREKAKPATYSYYRGYSGYDITPSNLKSLVDALGKDHELSKFFVEACAAKDTLRMKGFTDTILQTLEAIANGHGIRISQDIAKDLKDAVNGFSGKYALITINSGTLLNLFGNDAAKWFGYVQLVDKKG